MIVLLRGPHGSGECEARRRFPWEGITPVRRNNPTPQASYKSEESGRKLGVSMKPIEVLLVEDEAGDLLLMKQALDREPIPISIHIAVNGKQAAQILSEDHFTPNVIILDLNLPELSGLGFLDGYGLDAPVVVFTSSTNPRDRERCLELGAKECVSKPTDLDDYRHAVSQIVRKWGMAATESM